MRLLATLLTCGLASLCLTQDAKTAPTKHKPKQVTATSSPVTEAEARAVFQRAEKLVRTVTKTTAKAPPVSLGATAKAASREQLVVEFARLYDLTRPKFKLTPRPVVVDTAVLKVRDAKSKDRLQQMVKYGAVANYGPLAAGPGEHLTVQEFGDALGFFLARMAEMTHMPSTRWSPALMGG